MQAGVTSKDVRKSNSKDISMSNSKYISMSNSIPLLLEGGELSH